MEGKPLSKLFIDASGFIALSDKNDTYHEGAAAFYASLTKDTKLLTTLLVISETYTWLRYHVGYPAGRLFLDVVNEAVSSEWLMLVYPDQALFNAAESFLRRFHDQDLSYSDAISFAVLKARNIHDVFSFDRHFYLIRENLWPGSTK